MSEFHKNGEISAYTRKSKGIRYWTKEQKKSLLVFCKMELWTVTSKEVKVSTLLQ
jgi:hypothetical protein